MILGWIILSFILGLVGSNRSTGFWGAFLLSLILSPLIGFIILLFSKDTANELYKQKLLQQQQEILEINRLKDQTQFQTNRKDRLDKLEKLFDMKEKGILTELEYEAEKKNILSGNS